MRLLLLLFLMSFSHIVCSQEILELRYSDAVKIALDNNVSIKKAENELFVVQANKTSALAAHGPSISADTWGYRVIGNQFIEQEARTINDAETENVRASLNAQLLLFRGFHRRHQLSAARAGAEAQLHTIRRTKQDVIRDITWMYLQTLMDQEIVKIDRETLQTQTVLLKQIETMVSVGSLAEIEQITQEAIVKQAEVTLLRSENQLNNDKLELAQLLLIDPEITISLIEPPFDFEEKKNIYIAQDEMIDLALVKRADLAAAMFNAKQAKSEFKTIRANYMPSLSAYSSIVSFYSNGSLGKFPDQFDENLRVEYGLNLSIPIFNGLERLSSKALAKAQYQNEELDQRQLKNRVKVEVLQAIQNYNDAIQSYEAAKVNLTANRLANELEKERYNLGASDVVQIAQSTQLLVKAKSDYAQARYTLMFQDILLDYALGVLAD